jgi:hypothetical protein
LSIIEIEIDKGRSTVHEILIEIDKLPRSDVAPRKTSHIYMNIHEPRPRAAAIYVDFNQDFMHSGTWSIGMAVLVPLSISISISCSQESIRISCNGTNTARSVARFWNQYRFQSGLHAQWNRVHRNSRASSFVDFNLDFNQENRHNGTVPL